MNIQEACKTSVKNWGAVDKKFPENHQIFWLTEYTFKFAMLHVSVGETKLFAVYVYHKFVICAN